jgi:hypothetical protein
MQTYINIFTNTRVIKSVKLIKGWIDKKC